MIESSYQLNGQELETITAIIFRALQNSPINHESVEAFVHYKMNAMKYGQHTEGLFLLFVSLHYTTIKKELIWDI